MAGLPEYFGCGGPDGKWKRFPDVRDRGGENQEVGGEEKGEMEKWKEDKE